MQHNITNQPLAENSASIMHQVNAIFIHQTASKSISIYASAEIRVELYKIGLLRTINIYFLVIETFLNNVI